MAYWHGLCSTRIFCRRFCCTVPIGVVGVSSYGRVQSKYGVIHWGCRQATGYHTTTVGNRNSLVHRLVAHAFLGPPPSGDLYEINHLDGNKSNNRVDNLEYVSRAQNMLHYHRSNIVRRSGAEANSKPVLARKDGSETWNRFCSIKEAASQLIVNASAIYACCRGKRSSTRGFEFRYADPSPPCLFGEEWRPALHPGEGTQLAAWEVSSHGRVKSSRRTISLGSATSSGYRTVNISLCGRPSVFRVHRLVARAFLGPAPDLDRYLVHHRDADPGNNNVDNLQYVTYSENALYSHQRAPRSMKNRFVPVQARQSGSNNWTTYASVLEASFQLGVHAGSISRCCRGVQHSSKGYEFRRAESDILCGEEWRQLQEY